MSIVDPVPLIYFSNKTKVAVIKVPSLSPSKSESIPGAVLNVVPSFSINIKFVQDPELSIS